jgi:hypothetical protein
MALSSPTSLGNFSSGASHGTGEFSNSITTVDNSFLVLMMWATLIGTSTTNWDTDLGLSGGSLTYTQQINQRAVSGGNIGGIKCITAPVTTGATFNLVADCGAGNVFLYRVSAWYYTGHDTGSPVGGIAQGAENPMSGAVSITLNATPAATSSVLAALGMFSDNVDITEGGDFTELVDFTAAAGTFADFELQHRTGSTSTTVAWTTATSSFGSDGHAVGIEIKEAAAAAGRTIGSGLTRSRLLQRTRLIEAHHSCGLARSMSGWTARRGLWVPERGGCERRLAA